MLLFMLFIMLMLVVLVDWVLCGGSCVYSTCVHHFTPFRRMATIHVDRTGHLCGGHLTPSVGSLAISRHPPHLCPSFLGALIYLPHAVG